MQEGRGGGSRLMSTDGKKNSEPASRYPKKTQNDTGGWIGVIPEVLTRVEFYSSSVITQSSSEGLTR